MAFLLTPFFRWFAIFFLILASYFAAYWKGRVVGWDLREEKVVIERIRVAERMAILAGKRQIVSERVITQYVDRIKVIRGRNEAITTEVIRFTPSDDCLLDSRWRLLHDAAASNVFPPTPEGTDGTGKSTQADAIATVAENYARYHEVATRLGALQQWVREQSSLRP